MKQTLMPFASQILLIANLVCCRKCKCAECGCSHAGIQRVRGTKSTPKSVSISHRRSTSKVFQVLCVPLPNNIMFMRLTETEKKLSIHLAGKGTLDLFCYYFAKITTKTKLDVASNTWQPKMNHCKHTSVASKVFLLLHSRHQWGKELKSIDCTCPKSCLDLWGESVNCSDWHMYVSDNFPTFLENLFWSPFWPVTTAGMLTDAWNHIRMIQIITYRCTSQCLLSNNKIQDSHPTFVAILDYFWSSDDAFWFCGMYFHFCVFWLIPCL